MSNLPNLPQQSIKDYAKNSYLIQEEKKETWINALLIAGTIFSVLLVIFIHWFVFSKGINKTVITNTVSTPVLSASISGTLNFEGYAPTDAYISISVRMAGENDFKDVISGLVPNKDKTWTWKDATKGTNYEVKALLKSKGKVLEESTFSNVSAPATEVALTIVSDQQPPTPAIAIINGSIQLEGYIPDKSTVSVLTREKGDGNFTSVVPKLPAASIISWSWNNAIEGKTYDIQAELQDPSGQIISPVVIQSITAPSSGLLFRVSSNAKPPSPVITGVSGTISINGDIPTNSYINLGARKTGDPSFTEVLTKIPATNGVRWDWPSAQSGQQYDIQAYIWVNNQPFAQSNILTVTAPSANNKLIINAQQSIGAPSNNTLSVTCNGQQYGQFQATISYNTQANLTSAQHYKIVVTQASTGTQILNTILTPPNPQQSQKITTGYQFSSGITYFAQYAYSTNSTTFSSLSQSVQFECH